MEGINIEELENSESAIIETALSTDPEDKVEPAKTQEDKADNTNNKEIGGLELDALAALDDIIIEDKDNPKTPGKTEHNSSSQESFTFLASALVESGVLSLTEEELKEVNDGDKLIDAIGKQIAKNELSDLTEEQKKYVDAIRAGVTHEEYSKRQSNLETYNKITEGQIEENVQLQFELIRRSLLIKGISDDEAKEFAEAATQNDNASKVAIQAKNNLVEFEKTTISKKIEEAAEANQKIKEKEQETLNSLKSKINESSEIIPGIPINSKTKEKVFNSLTSPVNVSGDNILNDVMEAYKDPDYKIKLHTMHVITNGFKDFSKFLNTSRSKAALELEEKLRTQGTTVYGAGKSNNQGSTTASIADALKQMNF